MCRNVLIYFTEEAKDEVFRKFQKSLKPGGYLFIGSTEQIMNYKDLNYERSSSFFFIKVLNKKQALAASYFPVFSTCRICLQ